MRNIKLLIEYDGSRYEGWQKSASGEKSTTVKEKIEEVLSRMDEEQMEVFGVSLP